MVGTEAEIQYPRELLYDRRGLWLRPASAGIVRVGVNAPVAFGPGSVVYALRLPGVDERIEEGAPIGMAETSAGFQTLRAPLSGRVRRVNQELSQDAGPIRSDPFGTGWLFDLVPASFKDVARLLDAGAAERFFNLRRDLGPQALRAEQLWERGRPWWDEARLRLGGSLVARARRILPGRNPVYTPEWRVGDRWRVKVEFEGPSIDMDPDAGLRLVTDVWQYEVAAHEPGPDGGVYVLDVRDASPYAHDRYRLRVRYGSFTVEAVEELSAFTGERTGRTPNPRGEDTFLLPHEVWGFPFELPLFPEGVEDEVRDLPAASDPPAVQQTRFDGETGRMEVEVRTACFGEPLLERQVWERGLPWWREAVRRTGTYDKLRGALLLDSVERAR